ncbi:hypothetical protein DFS34DRAFT_608895 [Phlyctochytrium arcticum]|nr:hypothetical protein DFS34DRAFT_608895 [Phlyctochytrium arcticum]
MGAPLVSSFLFLSRPNIEIQPPVNPVKAPSNIPPPKAPTAEEAEPIAPPTPNTDPAKGPRTPLKPPVMEITSPPVPPDLSTCPSLPSVNSSCGESSVLSCLKVSIELIDYPEPVGVTKIPVPPTKVIVLLMDLPATLINVPPIYGCSSGASYSYVDEMVLPEQYR